MAITIELPISLSEQELEEVRRELAIVLYQRQTVSLAKAAKLASLTRLQFQRLLASRQIPINYSEDDLDADRETHHALRARHSEA
jgi:predicted HTH domain antitoxin